MVLFVEKILPLLPQALLILILLPGAFKHQVAFHNSATSRSRICCNSQASVKLIDQLEMNIYTAFSQHHHGLTLIHQTF